MTDRGLDSLVAQGEALAGRGARRRRGQPQAACWAQRPMQAQDPAAAPTVLPRVLTYSIGALPCVLLPRPKIPTSLRCAIHAREGPVHREFGQALSDWGRGVARRLARDQAGRAVRPARPNGAGKSTLIHCTTGLAQVTSGKIEVFGHDAISDYEEARQAVGLAPQEVNIDWFLTVEETLDYHAGYFGMPKRERRERTDELLETFSLTEKRDERTRTLSGGMKRRLILARAMMHRPRLLILDEPTAGVDVELRLELWHYVQRINQEGTTILLTTHYIEEAEQLCDRIAFINKGKIVGEGTSAALASLYEVTNLEDAYLALVGRKELSRSSIEATPA